MSNLYNQLIKDHVNFGHIIDLLTKEVELSDLEKWVRPNLPLILDALDYVRTYSECFHHPLEEATFDYLVENGKGEPDIICRIREQHIELEKETSFLQEQFSALADYREIPSKCLRSRFKDYIEFQREHITAENSLVLPLMAELSKKEWEDIATRVALLEDPVFDSPTRKEFAELFKQIDRDNTFFYENGAF